MRIEESITINRPPDEVFAFFDNRNNDKRWMDKVESSEWLEAEGSTRLGRRGRVAMRVPRLTEFEDEVTEYEPGRRVAHRMVSKSMVMHTACYADPTPGGTKATLVFEPERLPGGTFFGRFSAPFVARTVRRDYRSDLARLKTILEQGEADSRT